MRLRVTTGSLPVPRSRLVSQAYFRNRPDRQDRTTIRLDAHFQKKALNMRFQFVLRRTAFVLSLTAIALIASAQAPPLAPDIPKVFTAPTEQNDYVKRVVNIPMRDGVKLHTVIVVPKDLTRAGAKNAPIILTRTPYNADKRAERAVSSSMLGTMPQGDEVFVKAGYIRVFQDVRGKYGSEGDYVMTRPLRGPLNGSKVDHSTDAYDTIDRLVKNVKKSNGRA